MRQDDGAEFISASLGYEMPQERFDAALKNLRP